MSKEREALETVYRLLFDKRITGKEAAPIAEAILPYNGDPETRYSLPGADDEVKAVELRRHIDCILDFEGVKIPAAKGRRPSAKVTGKDIVIKKRMGVRMFEAALHAYWEGRNRCNAEMGRLMAALEHYGYIQMPSGQLERTALYLAFSVSYAGWDATQIRRAYSETMKIKRYSDSAFFDLIKGENERWEVEFRKKIAH